MTSSASPWLTPPWSPKSMEHHGRPVACLPHPGARTCRWRDGRKEERGLRSSKQLCGQWGPSGYKPQTQIPAYWLNQNVIEAGKVLERDGSFTGSGGHAMLSWPLRREMSLSQDSYPSGGLASTPRVWVLQGQPQIPRSPDLIRSMGCGQGVRAQACMCV